MRERARWNVARFCDARSAASSLVRVVARDATERVPRDGAARDRVRDGTASCARCALELTSGSELRGAIEAILAADRAFQQSTPGTHQEHLARLRYGAAVEDLASAARARVARTTHGGRHG